MYTRKIKHPTDATFKDPRMRLAILSLIWIASSAFATSYKPPARHDVFSLNRAYVLDVNPLTKVHKVYSVNDRSTPLWSFSCGVWHFPFLVSDDGTVVATVSWKHCKEDEIGKEDGVVFWNKDGPSRTHALADLCPNPPLTEDIDEPGPIGPFWRTWYTDVTDHGSSFTLRTTRGMEYQFLYATGEVIASRPFGWRRWRSRMLATLGGVGIVAVGFAFWKRRNAISLKNPATIQP
jgi:hypothetical protein